MGIRFSCRHCKKSLNVKETQAGLSGFCPFCQGVIEVPPQTSESLSSQPSPFAALPAKPDLNRSFWSDTRDVSSAKTDSDNILQRPDIQETIDGIDRNKVGLSAYSDDLDILLDQPSPTINEPQENLSDSGGAFLLEKPAMPMDFNDNDPIAEAPDRVWYYRNKDTTEKGPLKPKKMIQAITSKRVTIGSLVWRDDWEVWLPAERVFPHLISKDLKGKSKRLQKRQKSGFPLLDILLRPKYRLWLGALLVSLGLMIVGILVYWLLRVLQ